MRIEVALAMKTVKNHNILAYRCTIKSVQRGNVIVRVFEIFRFTICHYFHFETSQGLFLDDKNTEDESRGIIVKCHWCRDIARSSLLRRNQ